MQKLKTLYQGSESSDIQHWMKKLYSLKAKSLTDCKDVLHQISEIFSVLESNNSNLGDWEKTRIIYYSLPQCMRTQIHPDGTKKIKDFLTEVNNKVNFQIYLQKNIKYNQSIINNEQDDLMDIDFVGRRSKNDSSNQYSSKANQQGNQKQLLCAICGRHGHKLEDCEYNLFTKKNKGKKPTEQTSKSSKPKKSKNNKAKNENIKKGKSISNIEYDTEEDSGEISFDEIRAMYPNNMDSIETIKPEEVMEEKETNVSTIKSIQNWEIFKQITKGDNNTISHFYLHNLNSYNSSLPRGPKDRADLGEVSVNAKTSINGSSSATTTTGNMTTNTKTTITSKKDCSNNYSKFNPVNESDNEIEELTSDFSSFSLNESDYPDSHSTFSLKNSTNSKRKSSSSNNPYIKRMNNGQYFPNPAFKRKFSKDDSSIYHKKSKTDLFVTPSKRRFSDPDLFSLKKRILLDDYY
ncbi:hypothetical protein BCR36DRAFT_410453 [Piromyces finnis]|uniref:CCHC-type domain-containing protein n=1 Tax=Piromyces finnis TaxID=1754191 RepID=A0A1Y1VET8_9FUNG|nr:hypothetical protein BCR36DRAFT_410453 [Piromyces finnis]|eukprot:ORX54644.1 hypothetical protein BCR36DRAFT_410453 [Piromyces finnis]